MGLPFGEWKMLGFLGYHFKAGFTILVLKEIHETFTRLLKWESSKIRHNTWQFYVFFFY